MLRSAALSVVFPATVVVVERRKPGDPNDLLADEAHYVAQARLKRLQEFAAGRACARAALEQFGVHGFVLRAAADRQPLWPDGYVGSITHTAGFCAAAAASRTHVLAIGVDSECVGAPTPDIWSTICREEELDWLQSLSAGERPAAVTLVFSAKEAFYKCQYPLVSEWLDFHDLRIELPEWGQATGVFQTHAMRELRFTRHAVIPLGRYVFHEQFVSAGIAVAAGTVTGGASSAQ